jgi:hypothetical protein
MKRTRPKFSKYLRFISVIRLNLSIFVGVYCEFFVERAFNVRSVILFVCLFVCFPGVTTHCGCIFTAR